MIELTIKTLDSQTRSFSVPDDVTVKEFKEKIANDVNIPVNLQRLIYQGRVLQDEKKLDEYQVNGKVVHLVQRPPPQSRTSTTTRPANTNASSTTTSSGGPRVSRESIVVGAFTLPADVTDSNERIVQQVISGMGDIGRNARVTSRQSADGSSVDVHINLGQIAVPQLHSESQQRVDHVRNMIRQGYETIDRLENPPGVANSGTERMDTTSTTTSDTRTSSNTSTTAASTTTTSSQSTPSTTSSQGGSAAGASSLNDILGRLWNPDHPNIPIMADVLDEIQRLNRRLQPHLDRFQRYLREDPDFTGDEEGIRTSQRHCNLVTEVLHYLSHCYHAISDCMVDMTRPPPRVLRAPPTPALPPNILQAVGNPLQGASIFTSSSTAGGSRMATGVTTATTTASNTTSTAAAGTGGSTTTQQTRPTTISTPTTATPTSTSASSAPPNTSSVPPNASGIPHNIPGMPHNIPGMPHNIPGMPHNIPGMPHNIPGMPPNIAGLLGMASPVMMTISRSTTIPFARNQGTGSQGAGSQGTGSQGTGRQGTGSQGAGSQGTGSQGTSSQGGATTSSTTSTSSTATSGTTSTTSTTSTPPGGMVIDLASMLPVLQGVVQSLHGAGIPGMPPGMPGMPTVVTMSTTMSSSTSTSSSSSGSARATFSSSTSASSTAAAGATTSEAATTASTSTTAASSGTGTTSSTGTSASTGTTTASTGTSASTGTTTASTGTTTASTGTTTASTGTSTSSSTSTNSSPSGIFGATRRNIPVANFFGLNTHRDQFLPCASRHFFLRSPLGQTSTTTGTSTTTTTTSASSTSSSTNRDSQPQGEDNLADMIGNLVGSLINQHNPYLQPHPPRGAGGTTSSDEDSQEGDTSANNNNSGPTAATGTSPRSREDPNQPVLSSLLRGIRELISNVNNDDNPFSQLVSESPERSRQADDIFMTLGQGIDEQTQQRSRGESVVSAHEYMQGVGLRYDTMLGPGLLNDLFRLLARNLSFYDFSLLTIGQSSPLRNSEFRSQCQEFIREKILDGEADTSRNIQTGVHRFADEIVEMFREDAANYQARDNIDLIATNEVFIRVATFDILTIVFRSNATGEVYANSLLRQFTKILHEWFVLNINILQNGQSDLEEIIKHRIETITRDMNPLFRTWLTTTITRNIRVVSEGLTARPEQVQCFIREKKNTEPKVNGTNSQSAASPLETMETDPPVTGSHKRGSPDQMEVEEGEEAAASPVVMAMEDGSLDGADGWQAVVPADWVPIITNDITRQRRQPPQQPLSDAYLSGMPPKRRRLMTQRRPYGGVQTVLPNVLQRAITAPGVEPITNMDQLTQEVRENTDLHAAYEQQAKNSIQRRLNQDRNYSKEKYPNTETYFNQK